MGMDVNAVVKNQPMNQVLSSNSKISNKTEVSGFAKLFQMSSKQSIPIQTKPNDIDLALMLKQLQQLISKLQLSDQPIQGIPKDQLNKKTADFVKGLPEELKQEIEKVLDNANTFGDLLQVVKQDLNVVNLFALALALSGQTNQMQNVDKPVNNLPVLGTVIPTLKPTVTPAGPALSGKTSTITISSEKMPVEQGKLLKSIMEILQHQLVQPKTAKVDSTTTVKKITDIQAMNVKPLVGVKLAGQPQNVEGASKQTSNQISNQISNQTNEQTLGTMQFPISQQAQYKLHVTPEKVAENRFVKELQSIIQSGKLLTLKNGESQFQIKLFPESLGRLDITIIEKNGELLAKITATTQATKDLIESQLHHLKSAFQGQNIQIDKIDIQHQRFESAYQGQQQNSNNSKGQQQQENEHHFTRENETELEGEDFSTLLSEMNVV